MFALRAASLLYVDDFDFDSLTVEYIDFAPIGFLAIQELNVSAINFFLIYFKVILSVPLQLDVQLPLHSTLGTRTEGLILRANSQALRPLVDSLVGVLVNWFC